MSKVQDDMIDIETMDACEHVAFQIRHMTPTADLAERAKGTDHE